MRKRELDVDHAPPNERGLLRRFAFRATTRLAPAHLETCISAMFLLSSCQFDTRPLALEPIQAMVFTSSIFMFAFLPAFLLLYFVAPRFLRSIVLVAASFVFYGWWRPDFVLLMLFTCVLDYVVGARIARDQERGVGKGGRWLLVSLSANLGLLGYFKYANFGVETFKALMSGLGMPVSFEWTAVVLPVGISFYTFQTMSYTIDLYRKKVRPAEDLWSFLCYVTMFPQLVAGPIVRFAVVEQELRERRHSWAMFYHGVLFVQAGFVKKLLLADTIAPIANAAFASSGLGFADAWLGITAYSFQIYFDFSGYSDIAIGLGLMLGFHFPYNFDSPYRSQSITEFWRRWHMSLSAWLRDYLYISLGGNRGGPTRTYFNLSLTMLLGGLWHGASWNFVAWGGWQGLWLVIERLIGKRPWYASAPAVMRIAMTFVIVMFGWVLFRAPTMHTSVQYFGAMVGLGGAEFTPRLEISRLGWTALSVAALLAFLAPTSQRLVARAQALWVLSLQPLFLYAILHLHYQANIPFLYFQF